MYPQNLMQTRGGSTRIRIRDVIVKIDILSPERTGVSRIILWSFLVSSRLIPFTYIYMYLSAVSSQPVRYILFIFQLHSTNTIAISLL